MGSESCGVATPDSRCFRIAVPSKGLLSQRCIDLLVAAGYACGSPAQCLNNFDERNDTDIVYLRARDIAQLVAGGAVDVGFTGQDFAADARAEVIELAPLGFARSTVQYAAAVDAEIDLATTRGLRIATALPGLVAQDLSRRGVTAEIVTMTGAVENAIHIGIADIAADIVESGRTLAAHGLRILGPPLFTSQAVLVGYPGSVERPETGRLLERVRRVLAGNRTEGGTGDGFRA